MHVKAKKMALGGLLLALTVICMVLGSIIETGTLFLLAAASFFVGIIFREFGGKMGAAFYLAGVLLGAMLAPNKFYVMTYAAMAVYILAVEIVWELIGNWNVDIKKKKRVFLIAKYAIFNLIYLPAVLFFQELLFGRTLSPWILAGVLIAGQVVLFVYDCAYEYVQREVWGKIRGRFLYIDGS